MDDRFPIRQTLPPYPLLLRLTIPTLFPRFRRRRLGLMRAWSRFGSTAFLLGLERPTLGLLLVSPFELASLGGAVADPSPCLAFRSARLVSLGVRSLLFRLLVLPLIVGSIHSASAIMVGNSTNHTHVSIDTPGTVTMTSTVLPVGQIVPDWLHYLSGTVYTKQNFTIQVGDVGFDLGGRFEAATTNG